MEFNWNLIAFPCISIVILVTCSCSYLHKYLIISKSLHASVLLLQQLFCKWGS